MVRKNKKPKLERKNILIEDLRMLQAYIEALWRFLPLPICDVNGAFVIINVDKKFAEFFGFKPEEIIGAKVEKLFKYPKDFEEIKKELLKKKPVFNKKTIMLNKKNQEIFVSVFAEPRKEKSGFVISYFLAFIDMSEIQKKTEELQGKLEELEKFHKLAIGRELRMAELKKEIKRLKEEQEG